MTLNRNELAADRELPNGSKEARFVYPPVHLLILSFQRAHA